MTTDQRAHFGARLRREREARSLSIPDVVKATKIPERSLVALEAGSFEDLPAEVFVRGFLKSYCKSVGLECEEILASYQELTGGPSQKRKDPPSLAKLAPARAETATGATAATAATPGATVAGAPPAEPAPPVPEISEEEKEQNWLRSLLANAGRSTSRASLTVAVIILVIVATLTLSLLLRRPGHVGDGVSLRERGTTLRVA